MSDGPDERLGGGPPPYLDRLRFYRDEVKHEFNLLAMRSNILITCQSFLVVPFAILNGTTNFRAVAVPAALVAILGMYTAWVIQEPILVAHRLIEAWLMKQRKLLKSVESDDYTTARDKVEGAPVDALNDEGHERSMAFSKQAPIAFLAFWGAAFIWIVFRAAAGF